jgi:hypothetical protein
LKRDVAVVVVSERPGTGAGRAAVLKGQQRGNSEGLRGRAVVGNAGAVDCKNIVDVDGIGRRRGGETDSADINDAVDVDDRRGCIVGEGGSSVRQVRIGGPVGGIDPFGGCNGIAEPGAIDRMRRYDPERRGREQQRQRMPHHRPQPVLGIHYADFRISHGAFDSCDPLIARVGELAGIPANSQK